MATVFDRVIDELKDARRAATLENASFGFPNDRIEVLSVHFGDDDKGRVGDVLHPTDYVRKITRIHHGSWIINPIDRAIELLTLHSDALKKAEKLLGELERLGIHELTHRTKCDY